LLQIRSGESRVWDIKTGTQIRQFNQDQNYLDLLSFSPDGKELASGCLSRRIEDSRRQDSLLAGAPFFRHLRLTYV